jgi:HAD superfamily hydrolase (TIGR01549 family)
MKPFHIKAVLFDFDGTLTQPGSLDFSIIKKSVGCPADIPVLEFIKNLTDSEQQAAAWDKLNQFELEAAEKSRPNRGAESLIAYLRSNHIKIGIITRNSLESVERALQNFNTVDLSDFDLIITRNDPVEHKPSPDGILLAAEKFNADVTEMMMVGDFIFDIEAGRRAGAITVFLEN